MIRKPLLILAAGAALLAPADVLAQFGTIFGEPPPRPPGSVPRAPGSAPPPAQPFPQTLPPPPQTLPSPPQTLPPPQTQRPPGGVQSQPLPPPPGTPSAPAQQQSTLPRPGQAPLPGLPQGQRQPRGTPGQNTEPQPGDEVVVAPPAQRIANSNAVFSGLDKITGRIITFDAAINETVQFGALQVTPRACYTRPPTQLSNTDAFLEVDEITLQGEVRRIFTGWMFASSPGLHAIEHPIYDVWLVDCKSDKPAVVSSPQPQTAPQPAPASPPQTQRR